MTPIHPRDINVLVIVGIGARSVRALTGVAAEAAADGITVTVFDRLADLPRYTQTPESSRTPQSVVGLRTAAADADAVLVVTNYHDRVPAPVHNAIDWLTQRWNQGALHDKPVAVLGRAAVCYSGVWSHHETKDARGVTGARVIEPITVATLREAVKKLAGEAHAYGEKGGQSGMEKRRNANGCVV